MSSIKVCLIGFRSWYTVYNCLSHLSRTKVKLVSSIFILRTCLVQVSFNCHWYSKCKHFTCTNILVIKLSTIFKFNNLNSTFWLIPLKFESILYLFRCICYRFINLRSITVHFLTFRVNYFNTIRINIYCLFWVIIHKVETFRYTVFFSFNSFIIRIISS